jgi:SEC-C motif domain protein
MFCYCGTGLSYDQCCQPFILAKKHPKTAEQLMRSRYTAFATQHITYIQGSMAGTAAESFSFDEAMRWSCSVQWLGLQVLRADENFTLDSGYVCFRAYFREQGSVRGLYEKSEFKRIKGVWYYTKALCHRIDIMEFDVNKTIRKNDLCPCQSGKRFKRCCW